MGNKSSSAHGSVEEVQSRQLSNLKRKKSSLKSEYDYVFNDDDPRSWLPTDLTKSKLDLLDVKLCPGAPPPTHVSSPIPKTSEPSSLGSFYGSRQIEMAPFTFKRSRGQHPEGFETVPKFSIPSLMLQSTSKSSNGSSERPPTKMAQGDPYNIDELRFDKNYKPAWLPDVKPSDARTNLTPDSQAGILRRSRSFFGFKLKRSSSTDRKAAGESRSIQKIDLRSRSVSTHNSLVDSILQKWKRTYKIENVTVKPATIDKKIPEPQIDVTSGSSSYSSNSAYSVSFQSSNSPDTPPPGKPPKKPPSKKGPGKGPEPPKKDTHKKPPQPPRKPRRVQSQEETSATPQDGEYGGESGEGSTSRISYSTPPRGPGGQSPPKSDSRGSPAYSTSSSGNATPKGGKGKGGGKTRPPPPPVFISNCCGGSSKKSMQSPADRLENVDIVEELTYCCPTEGGGSGGCNGNCSNGCCCNNCCCDYYSCCNDCGGIQPVPNSSGCNNNSNPVKYCRRQRFNFNDGKRRDDSNDGPPFSWQDRPPNPFDDIPVGKNPVITCCECQGPCEPSVTRNCNVLPSDSGTYFYDAEQRSFVPVLEIETPETPRQEIQDEIIDEEPVLTNIEPIIQPMMQPMFGGCCPCPLPPFCGVMGQPCCINPCGNDSGSEKPEKGGKKGKSKSSKNKDSINNENSPNCAPDPGMMGLCGMNMPGLANMGPYGSLIVPQFNYQPPPCPPCNPCCPCPPDCPCCPPHEQCPCCPCPPCQPMSCAPVCFPPYGGYPMCCQGYNQNKKKKDKKKKKGNENGTQYAVSNNAGTNTNSAYGGGSIDNDEG